MKIDQLNMDDRLRNLKETFIREGVFPLKVSWEKYTSPRTVSQNALFHVWVRHIYKYMKAQKITICDEDGQVIDYSEEFVKELMKAKFLKPIDAHIRGAYYPVNRSTTSLSSGEMRHFMDQIYHWAHERRLELPVPADGEYQHD